MLLQSAGGERHAVKTDLPAAECFHPCNLRFSLGVWGGEVVEGGTEEVADAEGSRRDIEAALGPANEDEARGDVGAAGLLANQLVFELEASESEGMSVGCCDHPCSQWVCTEVRWTRQ